MRIESGRIGCQVDNFLHHLTFWQRLRWIFTGLTPVLTTDATTEALEADPIASNRRRPLL